MGVNHRIMDLADRENGFVRKNARPFESIVPLPEVISACVGKAVLSADASFDAAVFTSASAVRGALGALRESGVSVSSCGRLISIGPKTARELRQNGFDTLEAAHADLGGILEKMEELFHE